MNSYEAFRLDIADGIATLSLNRPEVRNAMNAAFFRELPEIVRRLEHDGAVRVLILRGEGPHFCAGIDLALLREIAPRDDGDRAREAARFRRAILDLQAAITSLEAARFPVIAAIHGACIGGGLDLVTAADIRVASADALFRIEETNLGIVADLGSLQRLPRIVHPAVAREMALTGRSVDAAEALRLGLVTAVLADQGALDHHARELAREIAARSPLAISGIKAVMNRDHMTEIREGLDYVATWNAGQLSVAEVMASLAARRGGKA